MECCFCALASSIPAFVKRSFLFFFASLTGPLNNSGHNIFYQDDHFSYETAVTCNMGPVIICSHIQSLKKGSPHMRRLS